MLKKAAKSSSTFAKVRCKQLKYSKLKKDEKKKCDEGETYGSGAFNS